MNDGRDRIDLALSAAGVGAWSLDMDSGSFWCDSRARETLCIPHDSGQELVLEAVLAAVHPNDMLKVQAVLHTCHDEGAVLQTDFRVSDEKCNERRVELVGRVVEGQAVGICRWLPSARKPGAEEDSGHVVHSLVDSRNELLAGINHELRTPVNEILGMIQLATDPGVSAQDRLPHRPPRLEQVRPNRDRLQVQHLRHFHGLQPLVVH